MFGFMTGSEMMSVRPIWSLNRNIIGLGYPIILLISAYHLLLDLICPNELALSIENDSNG